MRVRRLAVGTALVALVGVGLLHADDRLPGREAVLGGASHERQVSRSTPVVGRPVAASRAGRTVVVDETWVARAARATEIPPVACGRTHGRP